MKYSLCISLVVVGLFSCSEEEQNNPIEKTLDPVATEAGTPTGDAVTEDIGPSGGTLSSGDGRLDLIVPTGAVNSSTTFGIQPITNLCPGGFFAYRLLPEGLTFTNPVTLVFHYTEEDLSGTLPELLVVAYQGPDKIWYTLPSAVVDEVDKTISVEVKHFTDWTAIEYVGIFPKRPEKPKLRVDETIELALYGQGMSGEGDDLPPLPANPNNNPSPDEDFLPPLPQRRQFKARWFVNGVENGNNNVGTLSQQEGNPNNPIYVYKAPSTVPANNPVLISVEITGLKRWTIEGRTQRVTTHNKVILFKQIEILPDEYNYTLKVEYSGFSPWCTIDQDYYDWATVDVQVKGETVTVSNWVNSVPEASPLSAPLASCIVRCDAGPTGRLNVTGGSGDVVAQSANGLRGFVVHLNHTGLYTGASTTVECPGGEPLPTDAIPLDLVDSFLFMLADSAQTVSPTEVDGLTATLTPK